MAVDHWRLYLHQAEFIIRTDQHSLIHLDDQRIATPWQQKALTKLLGLQFKICYKKGSDSTVANALSRVQHHHEELCWWLNLSGYPKLLQAIWMIQKLLGCYLSWLLPSRMVIIN
jgi:hypothetical protein